MARKKNQANKPKAKKDFMIICFYWNVKNTIGNIQSKLHCSTYWFFKVQLIRSARSFGSRPIRIVEQLHEDLPFGFNIFLKGE